MMKKLAVHGWMFRIGTPEAASQPAVIYFAVGKIVFKRRWPPLLIIQISSRGMKLRGQID